MKTRRGSQSLLAVAAVLVAAFAAARFLPARTGFPAFLAWIKGLGAAGSLVFGLLYAAGTLLFFPGSILTLAAGFLYGPLWGTLIASPASVLGATAAFLLGRTAIRGWIQARVSANARFAALQEAIGKEGTKILILVRLSPIFPFSLVNYAFGLTSVSLRGYVFGSWIAMLPGTFLYVYLGSLLPDAASLASGVHPQGALSGPRQAMIWIGFAATAAVVVVVTRTARRALAKVAPTLGT